jgi:hypothetical protein
VVVRELVEAGPRDLRRHDDVITFVSGSCVPWSAVSPRCGGHLRRFLGRACLPLALVGAAWRGKHREHRWE